MKEINRKSNVTHAELNKTIEELTSTKADLEKQIESIVEEKKYIKGEHESVISSLNDETKQLRDYKSKNDILLADLNSASEISS